MRSLIGYLIVIALTLSNSAVAQDKEICVPESALTKMIAEIMEKDDLVFTISLQDSLLRVYGQKATVDSTLIYTMKLEKEEYILIIASLEEQKRLQKEGYEDALTREKNKKILSFLKGIALTFIAMFLYNAVK